MSSSRTSTGRRGTRHYDSDPPEYDYYEGGYPGYGQQFHPPPPYQHGYGARYNPYTGGSMDRRAGPHQHYPNEGLAHRWKSAYPYVPTSYNHQISAWESHWPPAQAMELQPSTGWSGQQQPQSTGTLKKEQLKSRRAPDSDNDDEEDEEEREHWGSKWEFIFSCIGLSVGIGNVWRFPTLAYENGGGSFLIPYFIILLIIGKPMYYMELALGQFVQRGPVAAWKMCPIGYGIGMAQVTVSLIVAIYYNVIMGYCLYYIFASFQSEVPWKSCSSDWWQGIGADDRCYERSSLGNLTDPDERPCNATYGICQSAAEQFFYRAVLGSHLAKLENVTVFVNGTQLTQLQALTDVGNIGSIKWDLTLCLLLSWFIVCACLVKGIKSSGKVVYFTATFPYVLLISLLIYGCFQDGAVEGIKAFFTPDLEKIKDPDVWRKAAEQMFFSLSVSWGGLVMFGSYNKFNHKVHITATAISFLDFITSIISGVVIFSILGALQKEANLADIKDVVKSGQGLAFIAYPEALAKLPVPQLWSVVFFFMLFLLGLDSEFALLETVLTTFYDLFPRTANYKPIFVIGICVSCFLLSLPNVSYAGTYVFQIMDDYGGGMSVMWIAILEMAVIMYVYGFWNLKADFDFMLQSRKGIFNTISGAVLMFLWCAIPFLLSIILGFSLYKWSKPYQKDGLDGIHYPEYVHNIGLFLVLIAVLQIPFWGLVMVAYHIVSPKKRLIEVIQPAEDWGPGDRKAMLRYKESEEPFRFTWGRKRKPKISPYINNGYIHGF